MSDESAFIKAILSSNDDTVRLVYADWLEERGDPRAEMVRLDVELQDTKNERWDELKTRFDELRPSVSLVWQAVIIRQSLEPRLSRAAGPAGTGPILCPNRICGCGNPAHLRQCEACQYPLPLAAGSVVADRYVIDKSLTLRGFGYIYQGVERHSGRPVVLKELSCADSHDFSYLVPFIREEAHLLSIVQCNPMVASLIEYLEQDPLAYLVVEHLGHESIADLLERTSTQHTFAFDWVVNVGKQICDLLDVMHRRDPPLLFVHLRLRHLYLASDQQTVKLMPEFHCTATWAEYGLDTLWKRLEGIGPRQVLYLPTDDPPPERIMGRPQPRSDLFGLAGVLYGLLTGRLPDGIFTGQELFARLAAIPDEERWLYELIAINLSENVCDRYYSARAFRADLERRAVTRRVTCGNCGGDNPVRQPHCGSCGYALTDWAPHACQRCHKRYRMGTRVCPGCGEQVEQVWG